MTSFCIDERLLHDGHVLGQLEHSHILLMNNAEIPWFILVPETQVNEIYQLESQHQLELLAHINQFSAYIKQHYAIDKLNIGAIGNIVNQLHVHIVGRRQSDSAWPGVIWGVKPQLTYTPEEIDSISASLADYLPTTFKRCNDT